MTQAAMQLGDRPRQPHVLGVIGALARRQRGIGRAADGCRGAWLMLAALLLAVMLDAMIPMPAWLRLAVTIGIILLPGMTITRRWRRCGDCGAERLGEAQRVEQRLGVPGNQLINGVALAGTALSSAADELVAALTRRAAERADRLLIAAPPGQALDRSSLRREGLRVLGVAAVWVLLAVLVPRLVVGGVLRFALPFADHPPFSWTIFEVTVEPDSAIPFAADATVTVRLTGKLPRRVDLVEVSGGNGEPRRWPMALVRGSGDEAVHARTLQAMTQSVEVFVETETGRSRRLWIEVAAPPVVEKQPGEVSLPPADSGDSADPARQAAVKAAALADAAQQIRDKAAELASRLESLAPDQPMPDWMRQQLQQLRDDIERFTGRSQSLEQLLRDLMKAQQGRLSKDAQLLKSLSDLADGLKATKLSGVKGQPIPSKAQAGKEARDAEKAAGEDLTKLKGGMAKLDQLLGGVTALTGPVTPPVLQVPDASGTAESHIGPGSQADLSPAVLRVVPPQYRELVARYFDRLAKDGGR